MKKNNVLMFSFGALGYGLIEILWRGFTHPSMLAAGGICFLSLARIGEKLKKTNIFIKAAIGGGFITFIELTFGIVFNLILHKNVWDYSKMPLNFKGQICFLYSFLWAILSLAIFPLAAVMNKRLQNRK